MLGNEMCGAGMYRSSKKRAQDKISECSPAHVMYNADIEQDLRQYVEVVCPSQMAIYIRELGGLL